MKFLRDYGFYFAWLIAVLAMGGSLYFSDIKGYVPCLLCWYQRILMYPLVLILGVAAYRQEKSALWYSLPLSFIGIGVAGYHYLDQKIPSFGFAGTCKVGVPCNHAYINWAGFITIPFLSLLAFILITVLLLMVASKRQSH